MKKVGFNLVAWILVVLVGASLIHILNKNNYKRDENTIVVGYDDTFVPMGFINNNGKVVGFDIDLAKAVGKRINKKIIFQPIDWTMKETELRNKDIDLIFSLFSKFSYSGIMRITVTVVVIMFELTGALTYILPTMVRSPLS